MRLFEFFLHILPYIVWFVCVLFVFVTALSFLIWSARRRYIIRSLLSGALTILVFIWLMQMSIQLFQSFFAGAQAPSLLYPFDEIVITKIYDFSVATLPYVMRPFFVLAILAVSASLLIESIQHKKTIKIVMFVLMTLIVLAWLITLGRETYLCYVGGIDPPFILFPFLG